MKTPSGYDEIQTGGGCTAWHRQLVLSTGAHVLITQTGDPVAPTKRYGQKATLTVYPNASDSALVTFNYDNVEDALSAVQQIAFIQEQEVRS